MTTPRPPTRAAFIFVFVTVALDMLALGIMVPVLPKLIVAFRGGDIAAGASMTGVFGFTFAAMQFVFSPVLGALSDRFGRRPVILLSNLGLGLDYVLMAMAPSLVWLFVGRVISGITAASFSTASAYIADVSPPEKRAAQFGMLGAAFGLGFVIGPAVGGLLGEHSLRLPFWVAGGLSLVNAAYGFFILPESLPPEKRARRAVANPLAALGILRSHREVLGLTAATFFYFLAHEALPSTFVLYTTERYKWDERQIGLALALVGISSTIVSALLIGPIVKRLGERRAAYVGLTFGIAGMALSGLAPMGGLFLAAIPLNGLWGITSPAIQAMMSKHMDPTEQGRLQGALSSLRGISGMIGPLLFTQVFAWSIALGAQVPGAPFLLASVLLFISLIAAWLSRPVTA